MAKVLFVQRFMVEQLGPMYLSSELKKRWHETAAAIGQDYDSIKLKIEDQKPSIIGIPLMTFSQDWGVNTASRIRQDYLNVKVVFGGPHPTFFHDFIEQDGVDTMVVGEAEHAFAELVDAYTKGNPLTGIKNIHFKSNGEIVRNETRPIQESLDDFAFPDRELYSDIQCK